MRCLLAFLFLLSPNFAQDRARPNVVLIISDDQGWGDFGFMGSADIRTPHLDALAKESLVFARGYVPTALCRASLATLITGLYPHQHKITGNDPPQGMERDRMLRHIAALDTLPKLLAAIGYRSLQTGKWWEGNCTCGGFTEGMTHGDPTRGGRHGDEGLSIGRKSMQPAFDFIDACVQDNTPFFLWYAPFLPHRPHNPPARILEDYQLPGIPESMAKYRAMCTWFDETCGSLLSYLDTKGITKNTLVVFVVDNGWIQREDRSGFAPRSKRTPYEGGVRTPILLRWPGKVKSRRREVPVSTVDIPTTILSACVGEVPKKLPGVDLLSLGPERGPVFGAAFTHDVVDIDVPARSLLTRWIVHDSWKLLVHRDLEQEVELYNIRTDPHEKHPIDNPDMVSQLRADLDRWWPGLP